MLPSTIRILLGQNKRLSTSYIKNHFNVKTILTICRRGIGIVLCLSSIGGLIQKDYIAAVAILSMGLIFLPPLDSIIFDLKQEPFTKHRSTKDKVLAIILRNFGVFLYVMAIGLYLEKDYTTASILLVIGLIILFTKPLINILNYRKTISTVSSSPQILPLKSITNHWIHQLIISIQMKK